MKEFDVLDTNCFRSFYAAAETLNFTQAAAKANATQSGVSQHIARLETQLGAPLFLRVQKSIVLTESGSRLKRYIEEYVEGIERLKNGIHTNTRVARGQVRYAMPASCLMAPHFKKLLERRLKDFPAIDLSVQILPSEEVTEKVLRAEIQFGFVTKKIENTALFYEKACTEEFVLVSRKPEWLKDLNPKTILERSFVDYPGANVLACRWMKFHFPRFTQFDYSSLKMGGQINHLSGALDMISGGVGIAVMPRHCIVDALKSKTVFEYKGDPSRGPLLSDIYIVSLAGTSLPYRVQIVKKALQEAINCSGQ